MHPLFQVLFDPGEYSCFADSPKGTRVFALEYYNRQSHSFFSINPLDGTKDRDPVEAYHHVLKPRRADANVTAYRNILLEMDKDSLPSQLAFIQDIGLPYTSCVYSGGKSYHFILSLTRALPTRSEYDSLVKRLYRSLGNRIDSACKNPSRLSRCPDHLRRDKMKYQDLRELRDRVANEDLERWLIANEVAPPAPPTNLLTMKSTELLSDWSTSMDEAREFKKDEWLHVPLYRSTWQFLEDGAPDGEWNLRLFKAACDVFQKGWTLDVFMTKAAAITGHLDQNDQATIRSAWRRTKRGSA